MGRSGGGGGGMHSPWNIIPVLDVVAAPTGAGGGKGGGIAPGLNRTSAGVEARSDANGSGSGITRSPCCC
jgi:hypothetical protein